MNRFRIGFVLCLVAAAFLMPGAARASNHVWCVRYSGGSDSASGADWSHAWATVQKAWNEVALAMGADGISAPPTGADHWFDIQLEATGSGAGFAGVASDTSWWDLNASGTVKRAEVNLRGGFDPVTGTRTGTTAITNGPGRKEAVYVNMNADHEQYLQLRLHDVDIRASNSAVQITDARIPQVFAYRSVFQSMSKSAATVDINGSAATFAYGWFDQSRIVGGGTGISLRSGGYRYATLFMTNSAVTGAATNGIRIQCYANADAPTVAGQLRNVTISNIGGGKGTAILVEHTGHDHDHDLRLDLNRVLVANTGTNVVFNRAFDERLILAGSDNAFHGFTAFTGAAGIGTGAIVNQMIRSLTDSGGNPRLKADGYHLHSRSPVANNYTMTPADPVVDIDNDPRPLPAGVGRRGDVGCDEVPPFSGTIVTVQ